ncbi:hypothetical protein HMPREF0673_02126 [Leyella stercorea DSM 18206]|uniref:Uncharacterized protein n=1 Tax=Leyella stercorea DSM 18206 TaxID=1002367 RepID=G6AZQ9_9BACT|nr:hypothetical protein HMPREF0673_02126 [Leyella stercorea DSM 18206]
MIEIPQIKHKNLGVMPSFYVFIATFAALLQYYIKRTQLC